MKKIILSFTISFLLCSQVWAQLIPDPAELQNPLSNAIKSRNDFAWQEIFDSFYVPSTMSTEARYSAGIFTSDIDNFIDINYFDPEIGTFLFLGGSPTGFGFAKTINCYYLGLYYHGSGINRNRSTSDDEILLNSSSNNNIIVFWGTPLYGSFRFDFKFNTETKDDTFKDNTSISRINAPSIALTTQGGISILGLKPYITIGYKFSDKQIEGYEINMKYYEATFTGGSRFGIQTGLNHDICKNSSIRGDISFVMAFADKFKGDKEAIDNTGDYEEFKGNWGVGFRTAYERIFDFGRFSTGLSPNLAIAYTSESIIDDVPLAGLIGVSVGLDLGLKYKLHEKLAFYSGANFHVFDCIMTNDAKNLYIGGLDDVSESNNFGLGMTFTPVKNLVIGTGVTTILNKFVLFDHRKMSFEAGDVFKDPHENHASNIKFDFTVSYKF